MSDSKIYLNQAVTVTLDCGIALAGTETMQYIIIAPDATEDTKEATISDASSGLVSYTFEADYLNQAGAWKIRVYDATNERYGSVFQFNVWDPSEWGDEYLITMAEVKKYLHITETDYDDDISLYIPVVSDNVKDYCRTDFLNDDNKNIFPEHKKPILAKLVWFEIQNSTTDTALSKEVKSKTMGPASWTYNQADLEKRFGYPKPLLKALDSVRKPV